MTELKTLKDFPLKYCGNCCFESHEEQLRQEAIKWVKDNPKAYFKENDIVNNWIKHFFNLTEEDLK